MMPLVPRLPAPTTAGQVVFFFSFYFLCSLTQENTEVLRQNQPHVAR
jgi:hypothetical protein